MRNIQDKLEQIIDNLLLIKNHTDNFSPIEKDILLQNLRDAYLLLLRQPASEETQAIENQEEPAKETQQNAAVKEKQFEEAEIHEEKLIEEENEEMDSDILEFIKNPDVVEEVKVEAEPEIKFEEEEKVKEVPEVEVRTETTAEVEPIPEQKPVIEEIPEPEIMVETEVKVEETIEPKTVIEEVLNPKPEMVIEAEVKVEQAPEPEVKVTEIAEPKVETVRKFAEILELEPETKPHTQPEPVKPQQRSLNDLFNEQKQDLGDKFQQTKITDLTKAMSINDKFLFIRELFKNKSEEFSRAVQTLNKCENIEEAFDIMEGLKKQYFWDSTSSAYLALCDLVRRKF